MALLQRSTPAVAGKRDPRRCLDLNGMSCIQSCDLVIEGPSLCHSGPFKPSGHRSRHSPCFQRSGIASGSEPASCAAFLSRAPGPELFIEAPTLRHLAFSYPKWGHVSDTGDFQRFRWVVYTSPPLFRLLSSLSCKSCNPCEIALACLEKWLFTRSQAHDPLEYEACQQTERSFGSRRR